MKAMLEDIAILTGGKAITEDLGIKLENLKVDDLGRAKKITIDKDDTTLVEGGGKKKDIEGRVKQLRAQVEETTSDYNAQTDAYENLVEAGVIDPTKVVRSALQNAASIAALLLSTEAVICEFADPKDDGRSAGTTPEGGMY